MIKLTNPNAYFLFSDSLIEFAKRKLITSTKNR